MRSKPQNAYLYKTTLSRRLLRSKPARLLIICKDVEESLFTDECSRLNLKPTPRNYGSY